MKNQQLTLKSELLEAFQSFVDTIKALRDPKDGCPWDIKQTHRSLRKFMLEEAYEAVEAMGGDDWEPICEELGDVLLQVVLNAQVADDASAFTLKDVIAGINDKMRRRHPHVFAPETLAGLSVEEVKERWQEIKREEKRANAARKQSRRNTVIDDEGVFTRAGCHKVRPATSQAAKIGEIAAKIDFDWERPDDVMRQVQTEIEELKLAINSGDTTSIEAELGDVYFSMAQLTRHLGLDPEVVALSGNQKFLKRFQAVKAQAEMAGKDVEKLGRQELEKLWQDVKKRE